MTAPAGSMQTFAWHAPEARREWPAQFEYAPVCSAATRGRFLARIGDSQCARHVDVSLRQYTPYGRRPPNQWLEPADTSPNSQARSSFPLCSGSFFARACGEKKPTAALGIPNARCQVRRRTLPLSRFCMPARPWIATTSRHRRPFAIQGVVFLGSRLPRLILPMVR